VSLPIIANLFKSLLIIISYSLFYRVTRTVNFKTCPASYANIIVYFIAISICAYGLVVAYVNTHAT